MGVCSRAGLGRGGGEAYAVAGSGVVFCGGGGVGSWGWSVCGEAESGVGGGVEGGGEVVGVRALSGNPSTVSGLQVDAQGYWLLL